MLSDEDRRSITQQMARRHPMFFQDPPPLGEVVYNHYVEPVKRFYNLLTDSASKVSDTVKPYSKSIATTAAHLIKSAPIAETITAGHPYLRPIARAAQNAVATSLYSSYNPNYSRQFFSSTPSIVYRSRNGGFRMYDPGLVAHRKYHSFRKRYISRSLRRRFRQKFRHIKPTY